MEPVSEQLEEIIKIVLKHGVCVCGHNDFLMSWPGEAMTYLTSAHKESYERLFYSSEILKQKWANMIA